VFLRIFEAVVGLEFVTGGVVGTARFVSTVVASVAVRDGDDDDEEEGIVIFVDVVRFAILGLVALVAFARFTTVRFLLPSRLSSLVLEAPVFFVFALRVVLFGIASSVLSSFIVDFLDRVLRRVATTAEVDTVDAVVILGDTAVLIFTPKPKDSFSECEISP
jgi:hypothetical protein